MACASLMSWQIPLESGFCMFLFRAVLLVNLANRSRPIVCTWYAVLEGKNVNNNIAKLLLLDHYHSRV